MIGLLVCVFSDWAAHLCVSSFFFIYTQRERGGGYPLISLWAATTNPPVLRNVHTRSLYPFNQQCPTLFFFPVGRGHKELALGV